MSKWWLILLLSAPLAAEQTLYDPTRPANLVLPSSGEEAPVLAGMPQLQAVFSRDGREHNHSRHSPRFLSRPLHRGLRINTVLHARHNL